MRGCALCILGCREQTNVFLFILSAVGLVLINRCRHRIPRFFPPLFHHFYLQLTTNESEPTRIHTISFHRRRNTLDCFFFFPPSRIDLPRGIWFIAVSEMQPTQWRVEQHRCYMLFSTFLRTVWVERMYKLLSSKISPRYVLRELHLAKKRGRDSGHADFFHPQLPYLSPPSPLFSHRSILLPSPTSLTDPSLLLFHFLLRSSSLSFAPSPSLMSFQILLLIPSPTNSVPSIHRILLFLPSPSVLTVPFRLYFRFLSQFRPDALCADGPMGFRRAFATGFFFHLVPSECRMAQDMPWGVDTLTSKPGPFLFFHFYAFSPQPF